MDIGTKVFWGIVVVLLAASIAFGTGVELRRQPNTTQQAG